MTDQKDSGVTVYCTKCKKNIDRFYRERCWLLLECHGETTPVHVSDLRVIDAICLGGLANKQRPDFIIEKL
jgi:hypothetical protein